MGDAVGASPRSPPAQVAVGDKHDVPGASGWPTIGWHRCRSTPTTEFSAPTRSRQRLTDDAAKRLIRSAASAQHHNRTRLNRSQQRLILTSQQQTRSATKSLDAAQARLQALDPARVLQRGWSITRLADGTLLRFAGDAHTGDTLLTQVADGVLTSTVD